MENLLSPRLLSHLWEIYFSLLVASPLIGKNPDHTSPQYGDSSNPGFEIVLDLHALVFFFEKEYSKWGKLLFTSDDSEPSSARAEGFSARLGS